MPIERNTWHPSSAQWVPFAADLELLEAGVHIWMLALPNEESGIPPLGSSHPTTREPSMRGDPLIRPCSLGPDPGLQFEACHFLPLAHAKNPSRVRPAEEPYHLAQAWMCSLQVSPAGQPDALELRSPTYCMQIGRRVSSPDLPAALSILQLRQVRPSSTLTPALLDGFRSPGTTRRRVRLSTRHQGPEFAPRPVCRIDHLGDLFYFEVFAKSVLYLSGFHSHRAEDGHLHQQPLPPAKLPLERV